MKKYVITTDASAGLSQSFIHENQIKVLDIEVSNQGKKIKVDDPEFKSFYKDIRNGHMFTTAAATPHLIEEHFRKILNQGFDILHLSFSSKLSSTYDHVLNVKEQLLSSYPDYKIIVIDTVSTTIGLRLLVEEAVDMRKQYYSIEENANCIESEKNRIIHQFVLKDLSHLVRGGRLSSTHAFIGNTLNIKPILHLNEQGEIVLFKNERGRKKALKTMLNNLKKHNEVNPISKLYIAHSDADEEAKKLKENIQAILDIESIEITTITPIIGTHIGADALVISYSGIDRKIKTTT